MQKVRSPDAFSPYLTEAHSKWWGTIPMPVATFLELYDFSGKTIIPFASHEGSGLGSGPSDIKKLCPNVDMKDGFAIRGGDVNSNEAKETVADVVKILEKESIPFFALCKLYL